MLRLLIFVATVVFVDTVFYSAITPLLPYYTDELGLAKSQAGVLAAAYAAGTLAGALPAGWMAARVGVRPTVVAGLALMSASSLAFAFAQSIVLLDVARFLQGVGGAASWAGALAWLIGAAPVDRRGELIGSAFAAAIVGSLFGPALGALADVVSPRAVFAAAAVAGAGMIGWALRMPPVAPQGARMASVAVAGRDPRIYAGMWLVALPGLIFGTIGVLAPLRLDVLGAGATVIALVFLGAAALEAIASPLAGRVADRRGRLLPAAAGVSAAVLPLALMPWPDAVWAVGVLVVLTGPAVGVLWAPALAMLSDVAEGHGIALGMAFAVMNLAWAGGHAIGAAGSARIAERAGDPVPFLLLSVMCAMSSVVLLGVMRRRVAVSPG